MHVSWRHLTWFSFVLTLFGCTSDPIVASGDAGGIDVPADVQCAAGQRACGGACATLADDPLNCGACGTVCPRTQVCAAGACRASCPAGQQLCGDRCVSVDTDRAHCGACGNACGAGLVCAMGQCALECGPMLAQCSGGGGADGGAARFCANTRTDRENCGACGIACVAGQICTAGVCVTSCGAGTSACGALCRDLQADRGNCGACNNACAPGQECVRGACQASCGAGTTECTGVCRDLQTDRLNCGICGNPCTAGQVCSVGACVASCGAGLANCGGSCRNLQTDPAGCGACGTVCPAPTNGAAFCTAGRCGVECGRGFGDCDGDARNGCEATLDTLANCGGCGVACRYPNAAASCTSSGCARGACAVGFANCNADDADGCEANTAADSANCGACGTRCAAGEGCVAGRCQPNCGAGLTDCSGACRNVANDPDNCTSCGNRCARPANATTFCASRCGFACTAGFGDCDGDATNGCETALDSLANCGACGLQCRFPNAGAACSAGRCAIGACAPGFVNCDGDASNGCETNAQTDPLSCGACGTRCAAGQVCSGGVCRASCAAGQTECSGACTTTQSDPNNCNICGNRCAVRANAAAVCAAGACNFACNAGYRDCDGAAANGCEAATATDTANCGSCGRACSFANATATCAGGACAIAACAGAFRDCNGSGTDGCEINSAVDLNHCGACGNRCVVANGTAGCAAGACTVAACSPGFGDCDGLAANGCETNLLTSATHCGTCATTCASMVCTAGACASGARTYTGSFVTNVSPPPSACTDWDTWRLGLGTAYTRVTIRGTFNPVGVSCTSPAVVNALATALRTGTDFNMTCDGHAWSLCGSRYHGELWLDPPMTCSGANCPTGYIVRPCQGSNWGGVNSLTCAAPSQTMTVDFQ